MHIFAHRNILFESNHSGIVTIPTRLLFLRRFRNFESNHSGIVTSLQTILEKLTIPFESNHSGIVTKILKNILMTAAVFESNHSGIVTLKNSKEASLLEWL